MKREPRWNFILSEVCICGEASKKILPFFLYVPENDICALKLCNAALRSIVRKKLTPKRTETQTLHPHRWKLSTQTNRSLWSEIACASVSSGRARMMPPSHLAGLGGYQVVPAEVAGALVKRCHCHVTTASFVWVKHWLHTDCSGLNSYSGVSGLCSVRRRSWAFCEALVIVRGKPASSGCYPAKIKRTIS